MTMMDHIAGNAGMTSSQTISLQPHALDRLDKIGKVLVVLPMEPQPRIEPRQHPNAPRMVDSWMWKDEGFPIWSPRLMGEFCKRFAPFRVDDVVFIAKLGGVPGELLLDDACEDEAVTVTVTGVEAKRVAELTHGEVAHLIDEAWSLARLRGAWRKRWEADHPDHPYGKSYVWLVGAEKNEAGDDDGDLLRSGEPV